MATSKSTEQRRPPYVPYATFSNFLADHRQGLPNRIDGKLLNHIGGTLRNQLVAALKYFDLVSDDNTVTDDLHRLVKLEDKEQKAALREIIQKNYPFIFGKDGGWLAKAADSEFRDKFAEVASGDTQRKSISFFLNACKEVGIPVSPFIQQPQRRPSGIKPSRSNGKANRRETAPKPPAGMEEAAKSQSEEDGEREDSESSRYTLAQQILERFDPDWSADTQNNYLKFAEQLMSLVSGKTK